MDGGKVVSLLLLLLLLRVCRTKCSRTQHDRCSIVARTRTCVLCSLSCSFLSCPFLSFHSISFHFLSLHHPRHNTPCMLSPSSFCLSQVRGHQGETMESEAAWGRRPGNVAASHANGLVIVSFLLLSSSSPSFSFSSPVQVLLPRRIGGAKTQAVR